MEQMDETTHEHSRFWLWLVVIFLLFRSCNYNDRITKVEKKVTTVEKRTSDTTEKLLDDYWGLKRKTEDLELKIRRLEKTKVELE